MASSDIKGFYRQKKKGGVSKPSKKKSGKATGGGATLGASDPAQTPALIAHGSFDLNEEYGEEEERMRQFDMDMKYGPCLGLSRLDRWQRASSMGLNPPADIGRLLLSRSSDTDVSNTAKLFSLDCLWEGRI